MNRCAICDYTEANGSEVNNIKPDGRKVIWSPKYNEYQCTCCSEEIKTLEIGFILKDLESEFEDPMD